MKLCIVAPWRPRFLAFGTFIESLVPELMRSVDIDQVVVLADNQAIPARRPPGIAIKPVWNPDSLLVATQTLQAIEREQPDVVWFQTGLMMGRRPLSNLLRVSVPALLRNRGIVSVVTLHNLIEGGPLTPLGVGSSMAHRWAGSLATRLLLAADHVCFTLKRYVDLAREHYGALNVSYVPHHTFGPVKARPSRGAESARFLTFGSLAPFKGLEVLAEAQAQVKRELPWAQACVAGGLHHRYPDMAGRWSRHPAVDSGTVRWLGQVSDRTIDRLMAWTDVVVVPNLASTGSSSVIHRAIAHGKAVIASDLPDFRAMADEEGLAIQFVPPGDAAALADGMIRLGRDPSLRQRLGATNAKAAERLTPRSVARQYAAVFAQAALQPALRELGVSHVEEALLLTS